MPLFWSKKTKAEKNYDQAAAPKAKPAAKAEAPKAPAKPKAKAPAKAK